MIRFESLDYRINRELFEGWRSEYGSRFGGENNEIRLIRRDGKASGVFSILIEDKTAYLSVWFVPGTDDRKKLLAVICEKTIRDYHPDTLVIPSCDEEYRMIYEANSFHETERGYEKPVEPWRKILSDRVFDEEGYIVNQGMMKDIPFGWFDTKQKGCGWIAAYNILKMNGKETTMERCAKELEKGALLGEVFGENMFRLGRWLKKQGLRVSMSLPLNSSSVKMIQNSENGIILYNHAHGAHYVTYRNLGNGYIQIYNAIYGKRRHVMKAKDFIKNFSLFPTSLVIAIK